MPSIRFANVLLETKPRALSYPTMYYHTDQLITPSGENGEWTINGAGTVDFTTYFNALSVLKLQKYTRATGFALHIDVKSAGEVTLTQTCAERLSMNPEIVKDNSQTVAGDNDWHTVTLDISVDEHTVLAGFQIATTAATEIRNGYYEVSFDGEPRDVELSIATTTFRKEKFIERNIELVKTELLASDYDIAKHLTMHVIDNGSTLDAAALSDEHVIVTPNENVGGAGGFARGMIESLEQSTPATHVLLMDDDVEVSPESILRTYNLLRIVNDEYAEAFVSGAMLNIEDTQDQKEDTGFISTYDGSCVPAAASDQVRRRGIQRMLRRIRVRARGRPPLCRMVVLRDPDHRDRAQRPAAADLRAFRRRGIRHPLQPEVHDDERHLRVAREVRHSLQCRRGALPDGAQPDDRAGGDRPGAEHEDDAPQPAPHGRSRKPQIQLHRCGARARWLRGLPQGAEVHHAAGGPRAFHAGEPREGEAGAVRRAQEAGGRDGHHRLRPGHAHPSGDRFRRTAFVPAAGVRFRHEERAALRHRQARGDQVRRQGRRT